MKVVVHVDGGARGNPGPAAAAAVVSTPDGDVLDEARQLLGVATNNVAEYRGLLLGLERARALGADEVEVVNDSELVAKQINGEYKVKHPDMKPAARARRSARSREFDGLAHPQRAPRAERRRRRARQPSARRRPDERYGFLLLLPITGSCRPFPCPQHPSPPVSRPLRRGVGRRDRSATSSSGSATPDGSRWSSRSPRRKAAGRRTGEVLVDRGVLTPDQLARVIAERFGVDHVDLNAFRVDMSAANLLPASAPPSATRPSPWASSTSARCSSRWSTRATSSRSTTSR